MNKNLENNSVTSFSVVTFNQLITLTFKPINIGRQVDIRNAVVKKVKGMQGGFAEEKRVPTPTEVFATSSVTTHFCAVSFSPISLEEGVNVPLFNDDPHSPVLQDLVRLLPYEKPRHAAASGI